MSLSAMNNLSQLTVHPLIPSFHPHLRLALNTSLPQTLSSSSCSLHLTLHLPDALFLDLSSPSDHFASQAVSFWSLSPKTVDIERPVQPHHTEVAQTLELRIHEGDGMVDLDIPMHARYLAPNSFGYEGIVLPKDPLTAGWRCRYLGPSLTLSTFHADMGP
jgi:hypothetical protein